MKQIILTCVYIFICTHLCIAQDVLYIQNNKELVYHYGVIAEEQLSELTEIEKIKYELRVMERSVKKIIDKNYQTLLSVTIQKNDNEQSWMNLAQRFEYQPTGILLYDKKNSLLDSLSYSAQELESNQKIAQSIRESGYHPGLSSFDILTLELKSLAEAAGLQVHSNEMGTKYTFTNQEAHIKETYNLENFTITREWIDEDGVTTIETNGYEPYLNNKGYLQRIWKTERYLTSSAGVCITEVKIVYYSDYEITDYGKLIDKTIQNKETILIYPNPNNGQFTVTTQTVHPIIETIISNIVTGESFHVNLDKANTFSVDMSDKVEGNYIIKVITNNNVISSQFIKN
jgi:hypothetical protein